MILFVDYKSWFTGQCFFSVRLLSSLERLGFCLFPGLTFGSGVPTPNLGSFTGSSDFGDVTVTRDGECSFG